MQIVVNITENHYKALMKMKEFSLGYYQRAIINGTVLPKGHGDLKDTQDIINKLNLNYNNHQTISEQSIKDIIQTIPAIIEADKGE